MPRASIGYELWAKVVKLSPRTHSRCPSASKVHANLGRPLTFDPNSKTWTGAEDNFRRVSAELARVAKRHLEIEGDDGGITADATRRQARRLLKVAGILDKALS